MPHAVGLLVVAPLLIGEYVAFIGRPLTGLPVLRGLVIVTVTFMLSNVDSVLLPTRLRVPG